MSKQFNMITEGMQQKQCDKLLRKKEAFISHISVIEEQNKCLLGRMNECMCNCMRKFQKVIFKSSSEGTKNEQAKGQSGGTL